LFCLQESLEYKQGRTVVRDIESTYCADKDTYCDDLAFSIQKFELTKLVINGHRISAVDLSYLFVDLELSVRTRTSVNMSVQDDQVGGLTVKRKVGGLIPHLVKRGVLHYADDTCYSQKRERRRST
jgi:hypothetical protein